MLEWADTANANPCVPSDASGSYTYAGKEHKMLATKTGASMEACSKLVSLVMGIGGDCGVPKSQLVRSCRSSKAYEDWVLLPSRLQPDQACHPFYWHAVRPSHIKSSWSACADGVCFQWHLGGRQTPCSVLHQLLLLGPCH